MNFLGIFILFIFTHYLTNGDVTTRLFDESKETIDAYPWMVSIQLNFLNLVKRNCSGVILSDTFVLTSASCFEKLQPFAPYFFVKAAVCKTNNENQSIEQVRPVVSVIINPYYNDQMFLNDLALVRVIEPFDLNTSSVFPIGLSNLSSLAGMNLTVFSWTKFSQNNLITISESLQQVVVEENVECTQNKSSNPQIQICTTGI